MPDAGAGRLRLLLQGGHDHHRSIAEPQTQADFLQAVNYWGKKYAVEPKNRDIDVKYASALRRTGRSDQAVAVLQKAVIYFPDDREVLAEYGKALAAAGSYDQALDAIRRAETPDNPNWQLISAEAAILDQMDHHDEARNLMRKRRNIPNEPTVLSNYGMSYVLTGELPQAEHLLRKAIAVPNADSRVRQNWRWWSACRAASPRPKRSPAPRCRRHRPRPISPISSRCLPSATPGRH